jgi:hypothetical protein
VGAHQPHAGPGGEHQLRRGGQLQRGLPERHRRALGQGHPGGGGRRQ